MTTAGLPRRLAAALYDALLLVALLMIVTAALLPLTGGEAVASGSLWYQAVLLACGVGFFAGFWTHGGQTLGMRAWRLEVQRMDGAPLRLRDALARAGAALLSWASLGMGFAWVLIDRDGLAWHDRLSRTRLVVLPPADRAGRKRMDRES